MKRMLVVSTRDGEQWYVREESGYDDVASRFDYEGQERISWSEASSPLNGPFSQKDDAVRKAREMCKNENRPGFLIEDEREVDGEIYYLYSSQEYNKDFWEEYDEREMVGAWNSIAGVPGVLKEEHCKFF